ncbi:MAG: xanthine dehydrogenase family protein molybdopterin-binding subunit [Xanthobacteraceae bacterium]
MDTATAGSGMKWVGRAIRRLEDPALVRGRGRFTADLAAAYFVRFVRSPVAAGRIVKITAPDGITVIRASDLSARPIRPMLHKYNYRPIEQPILAQDVVRFVGEPLAAVFAPTAAQAEDAADRVEIEIADLPAVTDARDALQPGAPAVHDTGNLVVDGQFKTAGFDEVLAKAHRRVHLAAQSHRQNATPLEARAAHASFDPGSGRATLTCTTQMPHLTRTAIADILGFPESDLRVVAPDVGGGFGQKMSLAAEYVVLVWLARKLGSSVAWIEDRRENLIAAFHSRDQRVELDGAFDAEGKLTALSADVVANVGAYSCFPTTCGVEPLMAMAELPGPYDLRAYSCRARAIATHTCTMAPYRGVSRPVITFAIERLMDKAAAAFGISPVEIRKRNLVRSFPYTSATGLVFDEGSYVETLDIAAAQIDMPRFRARQHAARAQGRFLGIGFASFSERTGYGSPAFAARGMEITPGWETVEIVMDPSGQVEARIGASPHGQGLATTLAQLVADTIGVLPANVRVVHGDTDRTPYGWGTFASRSLVISGGAATLAARKMREKLFTIAGDLLEASREDIVLEDGKARVTGTDRSVSIAVLARAAYHQSYRFKDLSPGLTESAYYDPPGTFSNACHVAIVDVDVETGGVRLERFVAVEDAGRIINPLIADGQVHGGIVQGIGNALLEEIVYDALGNVLTATLADYLPPTVREVPPIELQHIETPAASSVTGAKGLGEGGAIGAPAAILNAVNDALSPFAVSIDEMPATPQRIRAAIRNQSSVISNQKESRRNPRITDH